MTTDTLKLLIFGLGIAVVAIMILFVESDTDSNNDMITPDGNQTEYSDEHLFEQNEESSFPDAIAYQSRASAENDPCLQCHQASGVMEAVILDWENSKHADYNVSCIDCHEAEQTDVDAIDHNGYYMSPVVSPLDCSECHGQETMENTQSLHSFGVDYYEFLYDKGALPFIESHVGSEFIIYDGEEMDHAATLRGCQGCHGTNMTGKSVEDFTVWPNNGIGRINPDGSKGSCASCHTRHKFSVEEARKPETCGQCHMGPDHPQIEMYEESKHGNIYAAEGHTWNWTEEGENDTWEAGVDYRAPTCASCHMSGAPGVPATHDVSSRLSWELESAVSRRTDNIANSLGVEFGDGSTWQEKRGRMQSVCKQCHSTTWVENYYEQADLAVELYNEQYNASKAIVDELYADGLLTSEKFDEPIEFEIYEMWHHEGRRARMGAFMMAPDYVQWHGFYDVLIDKVEIEHMAEDIRAKDLEANMEPPEPVKVFLASTAPDRKISLEWYIEGDTIDHYEIYWETSEITDISGLEIRANATEDFYLVSGLEENTTYHFAIVAVNSEGTELETVHSTAQTQAIQSQSEYEDEDDDDDSDGVFWVLGILILVLLVFNIGFMLKVNLLNSTDPDPNGPKTDGSSGSPFAGESKDP